MSSALAKRLRLLFSVLTILVLIAGLFGAWFYSKLRASLPALDGSISVAGVTANVTIERDAQGVPTIRGTNRADVARGLGFLHGQDRFFQMDLTRRRAAGELSALFGKVALAADKRARVHGFRKLAQTVYARLPANQKELLDAYSEGVNAGLGQLKARPFEYLVLRESPIAWKPEDSVLMIYAMTLDLQDDEGGYEQSLAAVRDVLGGQALAYFAPLIGPDDAAIDGSKAPLSTMPSERAIDLRKRAAEASGEIGAITPKPAHHWDDTSVLLGSNGFALAGNRAADGGALVANDMHLALRLPNVWYRASLVFPHPVSGKELRVTGVTLPGSPVVVTGSNGQVAWAFTNADADMSDLVLLDITTIDPSVYASGSKLLQIEKRKETIQVHGSDPVEIEVPWTVYGPIVGKNAQGRSYALKWTAHDPETANYALVEMETATTVEEGIAVAHRAGIPIQNAVIADHTGKIGWTICGKLPKRVGFDGRLPVNWTYGDRRWDGYLADNEVPTVIAPEAGQIWTANQRVLNSEALLRLGDGGYERPQRAARIRDLMTPLQGATPKDLLAIQLDTRAPYLDRWHELLDKTLTSGAIAQKSGREKLKAALNPWDGKAEPNSISYAVVRRFRDRVIAHVLPPIFAPCAEAYQNFSYRRFHIEPAVWDILTKRPAHLLDPQFATWDDLLLMAADEVMNELNHDHVPIDRATWGRFNTARIQHPFGKLSSLAGKWLSAPKDELAGDYNTPRVQAPDDGASERFVVSPGHEENGIFHMPGGQSGHPLSPFFLAGHEAWVRGEPTPFLPGKTAHTLTLTPASK